MKRIEGSFDVRFDEIDMKASYKVGRKSRMDLGRGYEVESLIITDMHTNTEKAVTEKEFMYLVKKAIGNYFLIERTEFM